MNSKPTKENQVKENTQVSSTLPLQLTQVVLNSLVTSQESKQKMISSANIQEGCVAEVVAKHILNEILAYQAAIPDENDDVAVTLVQFNENITIDVKYVGHLGYNLITFVGTDSSGKPRELIQNVSQLNILLTTTQKRDASVPRREIGFRAP